MEPEYIRVLSVEDNPADTRLIEEILAESEGTPFDLIRVDRLSAAQEHLTAGGIDLVLLDLTLPDAQGLHTLMGAVKQSPDVPIVVLTELDDEELSVAAAQLGVEEFLIKSDLDGARLHRSIRCALIRHRMEAALRRRIAELEKREERLRKLIRANADTIIVTDRERSTQFVNAAAETLLGSASSDLRCTTLGPPLGETVGINIACPGGLQETAEMRSVETEWDKKSDYPATLHDVTAHKLVEYSLAEWTRELECANEDLIRRNAELDEFTCAASHDLQEPLRKLTAFCKLLPDDLGSDLPVRARTDLNHIINATKRMQTLVQDLLSLSRTGREELAHTRVSLDECADLALDALSVRIRETGVEITRDKLPQVWGDRTRLIQLYQNLIGNALKFRRDGTPVLHLTAERQDGHLVLGVKDNGIGIKPEDAARIFSPFTRLHSTGEYPGTGIGLAICRKVVERHGGEIWVESELGKGSHFRFILDGHHKGAS